MHLYFMSCASILYLETLNGTVHTVRFQLHVKYFLYWTDTNEHYFHSTSFSIASYTKFNRNPYSSFGGGNENERTQLSHNEFILWVKYKDMIKNTFYYVDPPSVAV
jgi:hypothetical protein